MVSKMASVAIASIYVANRAVVVAKVAKMRCQSPGSSSMFCRQLTVLNAIREAEDG